MSQEINGVIPSTREEAIGRYLCMRLGVDPEADWRRIDDNPQNWRHYAGMVMQATRFAERNFPAQPLAMSAGEIAAVSDMVRKAGGNG
jgi:hypothetical protein